MKKLILFFFTALALSSCSSDSSQGQADQYDRKAMLQNWADNIIVPSLQTYNQKLSSLKTATQAFTAQPDATSLAQLKTQWLQAYKAYQYVAMFNIGKADEIQLSKYSNTYPTDTAVINTKINSGDISLDGPANDIAQGFPALDYLLFGLADTPEGVVALYTQEPKATNYKNYLTAVVERLNSLAATVLTDWNGGYKNTFISKTDNTSSGSVNKMVNAYVQFFEKDVRSGKVGIPAGRFSTTPLPEKVEGFYSRQYSKELLLDGLASCRNFFNGKYFDGTTTGPSLSSYLDFLQAKGNGGDTATALNLLMDNQFAASQTAINNMQGDLYLQVISDNTKMLLSFDAMQRNVAYMKTDMVSAMSISITYADTDGD